MNRKTFLTTIAALFSAPFFKRKRVLTNDQKTALIAGVALIETGAQIAGGTAPVRSDNVKLSKEDLAYIDRREIDPKEVRRIYDNSMRKAFLHKGAITPNELRDAHS